MAFHHSLLAVKLFQETLYVEQSVQSIIDNPALRRGVESKSTYLRETSIILSQTQSREALYTCMYLVPTTRHRILGKKERPSRGGPSRTQQCRLNSDTNEETCADHIARTSEHDCRVGFHERITFTRNVVLGCVLEVQGKRYGYAFLVDFDQTTVCFCENAVGESHPRGVDHHEHRVSYCVGWGAYTLLTRTVMSSHI